MGWLKLQAALSAVALVVFAVRAIEVLNLMAGVGAPLSWRTVAITQGAFWLAWSLWAGALIPLVRRIVERAPPRGFTLAALAALALAPLVVVPALSLPFHRLALAAGQGWPATFSHLFTHNLLINLLVGAAVLGVAYGWLATQHARRLEVASARLHGQLADAHLDSLRARLDPHFLFNALNSVAVLARRGNTAGVEEMVTRLAGLLRHSLESSRTQVVTLGVELEALRHYCAIEEVRHGDRLVVTVDVPDALLGHVVPSFLLQPLAENAIRHGAGAGEVLHLDVRAAAMAKGLQLTVTDDGVGLDAAALRDGEGIGNTRARLAGLYGAAASLAIMPGAGGRGTRVQIVLPKAPGIPR